MKRYICHLMMFFAFVASLSTAMSAQTTAFTYQGNLTFSGQPANGNFDFEFALFDAAAAGGQLGSTQTVNNVAVANGNFTVNLDFGSQFPGANRFLEIRVRQAGQPGITILSPRQPINSTPYSVKSISADTAANAVNANNATTATTAATATNALNLGGVAANQYVLTGDTRLSDARAPLPNSSNYIQNTTTVQTSSNLSISGAARASTFDAFTQFNIGGDRVLFIRGTRNTFVGVGVLNLVTTLSGTNNSFFGRDSGLRNSSGSSNSFFGSSSGQFNSSGAENSFFGARSGADSSANFNSFFGSGAGEGTTTGSSNSFFGRNTGTINQTGSNNSLFGSDSNVLNFNLTNASAIGARAAVGASNSIVLGSINGVNAATSDTNVGIGTTVPSQRLHVVGNVVLNGNVGIGTTAPSQPLHVVGNGVFTENVGIGTTAPRNRLEVGGGILVTGPRAAFAGSGLTISSESTFDLVQSFSNRPLVLNGIGNFVGINNTAPSDTLDVLGRIRVSLLGTAGATSLCRNASNQIATCSSSLRYKTNISPFAPGMSFINQLRPIAYEWTADGMKDVGFGAEDVAKIDPRFVTYNDKGEVEGIKYDRMSAAFVNAFTEQQTEIETLRKKLAEQKAEFDALKSFICSQTPAAVICSVKKEEK